MIRNRILLALGIVIFLLPVFFYPYTDKFILTVGFTATYLGYSLLLMLLLILPTEQQYWKNLFLNSLLLKGIAWVGFYSYSIYLFHFFVGFGAVSNFRRLIGRDGPIGIELAVFIGANIIFGYLISRFIEQQFFAGETEFFLLKTSRIGYSQGWKKTLLSNRFYVLFPLPLPSLKNRKSWLEYVR